MSRQRWIIGIATVTFIGIGALVSVIFNNNLLSKFVSVIFATIGVAIPVLQVVYAILPNKTSSPKIKYARSYSFNYVLERLTFLINITWPFFIIVLIILGGILIKSNVQQAVEVVPFTDAQVFHVGYPNDNVNA